MFGFIGNRFLAIGNITIFVKIICLYVFTRRMFKIHDYQNQRIYRSIDLWAKVWIRFCLLGEYCIGFLRNENFLLLLVV